ncbi:MAG: TlpA family protein disulfide reductase [Chloroflexi bacterium]|nr:MAG: TlpA family protein disulfide reductase [Chloroflexota bacterium]
MDTKDTTTNNIETREPVTEPVALKQHSRKRNITIFVIVSILNAALLALLWTQLLTPAHTTTLVDDPSLTGDVSASPLLGKQAPDFTLPMLDDSSANNAHPLLHRQVPAFMLGMLNESGTGKQIHLSDYKGTPVIMNFWASWCAPCTQEAPFMAKSWTTLQAQGVVLIGVDGAEPMSNALTFTKKYGLTYTNVRDTINGATAIAYGVTSFPETVFINGQGVVVAKWQGALNEKGLQLELAKMGLSSKG